MQQFRGQVGPQCIDQIKKDICQFVRIMGSACFFVDQISLNQCRTGLMYFFFIDLHGILAGSSILL